MDTDQQEKENSVLRRLVELTRDLILIPSTKERIHDVERCLEFVVNHVEGPDGLKVNRYQDEGIPSVVVLPKEYDKPEVLLSAHLDVVSLPAGTEYRSSISNGRIVGPGAGDMKGELAILLEVFRRVHESHPGASLGLVVTSDEEQGGDHGLRFLFEKVGLRCGTAIIPDSGSLNEIAVEEKGILHLRIVSKGLSGHASRPWLADNPLSRLLSSLHRAQAYFESLDSTADYWHPTFAVTIVRTPNNVVNRIPELAEAVCDIRFPPPFTSKGLLSVFEEFLDEHMTLEPIIIAEPVHLAPDPLFVQITAEVTGQPVRLIREHGGSDARFVCRYGIPVIMSRPYVGDLHSDREWVDIASMEILYRIYTTYLEKKLQLEGRTEDE